MIGFFNLPFFEFHDVFEYAAIAAATAAYMGYKAKTGKVAKKVKSLFDS